jgi:hypothetical protein
LPELNLWTEFRCPLNKRNGNKMIEHTEVYLSSQYVTSWSDDEEQIQLYLYDPTCKSHFHNMKFLYT